MSGPVRIQRKRTKGWKMPANTVYVGRPTKWGNPSKTKAEYQALIANLLADWQRHLAYVEQGQQRQLTFAEFCSSYRGVGAPRLDRIHELSGKNLACWCAVGSSCHADVLLTLANPVVKP